MATERRDSELIARPIRAVFDSNIYVAAYLSKNPRSPNKELFRGQNDIKSDQLLRKIP